MFSSNKRKSTSSKSAIAPQVQNNIPSARTTITTTTTKAPSLNAPKQEPIADDLKLPDSDDDSANDNNFDRDLLKPPNNIKESPSLSTLKSSSKNSLDEKIILSSTSKPLATKPIKSSSLPIKINQSNHNESSLNPKNDPIISSSTNPPISSHVESKIRRSRSSTIHNSKISSEFNSKTSSESNFKNPSNPKISSESKGRGSVIGESPTKIPQKHKRTGSAPILNVPSISTSMINNLNKITSSKSMVDLNVFEAKIDKETPKQYLDRMMYSVSRSKLVTILTQKADNFHQSALKAYMEIFEFEKVPIDLALRKLLMECSLPKETQQIDRVMEAFAKSYHESNPDLFPSADTPYMLAFSLLMLHTDVYNKSVKQKMTKEEFVKNTRIDGVNSEILEHRQMRLFSSKERRKSTRFKNDPYWVIQTKSPTEFKPKIKDIVPTENPYSYMGTLPALDITNLHRVFSTSNTIRITGVKNRHKSHTFKDTSGSFQSTNDDGAFLLNITKCGKLGRKIDLVDGKRKSSFIRHWKIYGKSTLPILKPDVILMTSDSVAVYDKNYKKHKNVFRLVCPKGHQYLFKAENEDEMNDWISKINYAATFKTAGLKMRNIRNPNIGHLRR
ncbi:2233_t:CDS:2, partial [Cetraspora pellucida]